MFAAENGGFPEKLRKSTNGIPVWYFEVGVMYKRVTLADFEIAENMLKTFPEKHDLNFQIQLRRCSCERTCQMLVYQPPIFLGHIKKCGRHLCPQHDRPPTNNSWNSWTGSGVATLHLRLWMNRMLEPVRVDMIDTSTSKY